jgi:long-chain acyl-CoA synthetase
MNASTIVLDRADEAPARPGLWFEDDSSLTYGDIDARTAWLARRFHELGFSAGDWLGVYLENTPEVLLVLLGAMRAGLVYVPAHLMVQAGELRHILGDSGAAGLVADPRRADVVAEAVDGLGVRGVMTFAADAPGGWNYLGEFDGAVPDSDPILDLEADHPAFVIYTSGTTGAMKGVVQTHSSIVSWVSSQGERQRGRPGPYPLMPDGTPPNIDAFPLSHGTGVLSALFAYWVGRSLVMMRKFEVETYLRLASSHHVDNLFGAPTMFQMLATSDLVDRYDLSSVKIAMCGGAPLPPAVAESFEQRLGVTLIQTYGQSETGPIATWSPKDVKAGIRKPGSVGKLVPGVELRVLDEDGHELAPGEQGELVARSPNVMKGYIGGEAIAQGTVTSDGWIHTGDIGYVDEDGWIYITGRKRELIIVGGFNVYPAEVENALLLHPAVSEAAVVGIPDERLGEIPLAYVVAGPGVDEAELIQWTRQKLAKYKAVRRVEFVEELKRGATEKVLVNELQQAARGGSDVRS